MLRHQCRKTAVLSCVRFLINSGVEKKNKNMDYKFVHQMSLSKSKCWYSNNCLHFFKACYSIKKLERAFSFNLLVLRP
jgi:hypothetical protein